MNEGYTADPRFDPLRNARELGLRVIPKSFLGGSETAGSTDATAVDSRDLAGKIPWVRVALVVLAICAVWKLGK